MITLLQRVTQASVTVNHKKIGEIQRGLLAFVAVEPDDTEKNVDRLLERILNYRIFEDHNGKMNLNLKDIQGGLLLVSQFTLAADTKKGNRPSFSSAASPELGKKLFEELVKKANTQHSPVATGEFGADMQVALCNDGPVTIWLTA